MGSRYQLPVVRCPKCAFENEDIWYAPTSGFLVHNCEACGFEIDLGDYTGISYEEASNRASIGAIIEGYRNDPST